MAKESKFLTFGDKRWMGRNLAGLGGLAPVRGVPRPRARIAKAIMREKLFRFRGFEDWYMGEPSTGNYQIDGFTYPRLQYSTYDLALTNVDNVNIIRERMYEILDDKEYHTRFAELHIAEEDLAFEKRGVVWRLRELVEYIELGNNLEGQCSACNKALYKKSLKSAHELMKIESIFRDARN